MLFGVLVEMVQPGPKNPRKSKNVLITFFFFGKSSLNLGLYVRADISNWATGNSDFFVEIANLTIEVDLLLTSIKLWPTFLRFDGSKKFEWHNLFDELQKWLSLVT